MMAFHAVTITAAVGGSVQPVPYRDNPEGSPPPYPYEDCERQLLPQPARHIHEQVDEPPEYNLYDVERGSLIEIALAQYAQSITPIESSTGYSALEQDEHVPWPVSGSSGRFRHSLFYCVAMFCGATWAILWICAIGYAIVISFQKVSENLV
jgi:hypothetical protein